MTVIPGGCLTKFYHVDFVLRPRSPTLAISPSVLLSVAHHYNSVTMLSMPGLSLFILDKMLGAFKNHINMAIWDVTLGVVNLQITDTSQVSLL